MSVNNSEEIVEACNKLIEITGVTNVLVTRGSMGMSLISKDDKPFHLPALAREIYDVSGAGDTVVSVFATGLSVVMEIRDAATLANIAAGLVVSKVGTAVVNKSDLESSINAQRGSLSNIYDENNLMKRIAQWQEHANAFRSKGGSRLAWQWQGPWQSLKLRTNQHTIAQTPLKPGARLLHHTTAMATCIRLHHTSRQKQQKGEWEVQQ